MDYKKNNAPTSVITRDTGLLESKTGNIYETVVVASRRANQIGTDLKNELNKKLEEFASYTDNLEEIFENREQIEISKFYERLPKPTLMALQELLEDKISIRIPTDEEIQQAEELARVREQAEQEEAAAEKTAKKQPAQEEKTFDQIIAESHDTPLETPDPEKKKTKKKKSEQ